MKAGSEPTKREREVVHAEECCKLANDRFHLQEQVRHLQAENQHFRGLLLWALYHHQGATSPVGLPIRKALDIPVFDSLSEEEIVIAKLAAEV